MWTEMRTWLGTPIIIGNVMLTTTSSLVQQVKIRATTASTDTIRGVGVSGGAGIQGNVNVGGNAIILSDIE
jgi:hypothetical protein